jgi:hypothetical protein
MYDNCPQLSILLNHFRATVLVIPAKAGIQLLFSPQVPYHKGRTEKKWQPHSSVIIRLDRMIQNAGFILPLFFGAPDHKLPYFPCKTIA